MAELRPNRIKRKLAEGGVATVPAGVNTPDMIDLMGPWGFDGFWIEAEHGPVDFGDIADLTRACDLWGVTSIVRVNRVEPGIIYRTLDQGAQGIVVPHVNTADEARQIVDAAKFAPIGHRGMFGSRQGYGVDDYLNKANDETLIVILVEDIRAVHNLPELLEVDHIDVFFVAPSDLGQSMGILDNTAPEIRELTEKTIRQIVAAGRVAGTLAFTSDAAHWIDVGARFLHPPWTPWLEGGAREFLKSAGNDS